MPVDRSVQIVVAADRIAVLAKHTITLVGVGVAVAHGAAQQPSATAGGDLAQFLDVNVDQVVASAQARVRTR
jgi:hypothetical protein